MNKNFRFTKQKKIVLDEVTSRFDHPTADQIYENVHRRNNSISKSTVYRNLDVLEKEGLIKRIKLSDCDRFDLTLKDHYHLLCKVCNRIFDTNIKYNNEYDKKVSKETGFIIYNHSILFEGICPECQNKLNLKEEK